jgi:hypothetical protein
MLSKINFVGLANASPVYISHIILPEKRHWCNTQRKNQELPEKMQEHEMNYANF